MILIMIRSFDNNRNKDMVKKEQKEEIVKEEPNFEPSGILARFSNNVE